MRTINKVILLGNLTRDPEIRKTLANQSITTFGMATNREWLTKDGRKQEASEFHEIVCWGKLAEIASQYLKKGKAVYIEGYLKTRSWDDTSGLKKFRTEIIADNLIMIDKPARRPGQPEGDISAIPTESSASDAKNAQPSITIETPFTI